MLQECWQDTEPANIELRNISKMLKSYFGVEEKKQKEDKNPSVEELKNIFASLNGV